MSLETRSNSALVKRAEQLKRWQESETAKEPSEPKSKKSRRIGFSDGCVFLAACAAGDTAEVSALLSRGADIDTSNVDGLTALHQACIDDNLDMCEFLVENKADVNRGDNEGWTPLHATASCGFLSIARYLLENRANVAAVNNDGELAIDISESDEMEELLQKEILKQRIDCEEARNREEREMMNDARQWINSGLYSDVPHPKTGASALHVAAAKGYIKVMNLVMQSGAIISYQDSDGWTPLHAAAHWAQREACELLVEHHANMEVKNCVGQTCFDVADPDVLRLLEDLKKKQASLQKDRPILDLSKNINVTQPTPKRRSSITRLSYDDKLLRSKEATVKETIAEEKASSSREDKTLESVNKGRDYPGLLVTDEGGKEAAPGFAPPQLDSSTNKEEVAPWRRPGSLRARPTNSISSGKLSPSIEEGIVRRAHSFGSDDKFYAKLAELRQRIRANSLPVLHQDPASQPPTNTPLTHPPIAHTNSLPRPAKSRLPSLLESSESPSSLEGEPERIPEGEKPPLPPKPSPPHSFTSMITAKPFRSPDRQLTELTNLHDDPGRRVSEDISKQSPDFSTRNKTDKGLQAQVRRSFVPPVRDEEHEIQRKAHAKRVRETRRSTQGVTLEDLKSAEQLVKKKQQQENAQRTTELQQLVQEQVSPDPPGSTATTTVATSATLVTSDDKAAERRPSWRLRIDSGEKSRFTLEDSRSAADRISSSLSRPERTSTQSPERRISRPFSSTYSSTLHPPQENESSPSSTPPSISRKKKPKRRSTGVVNIDMDDFDKTDESGDENIPSSSNQVTSDKPKSKSQNGDIDYKKLWEESQTENTRLRMEMSTMRHDLDSTKHQLESAVQASQKNAVSDAEKREKKILEKKLSEMEEELKTLDQLKSDNQRLRDENGALIRVISKLSK